MKKIDNIEQFDDLLKQQFDSFAPEPPAEVWQSLSQHPAIGSSSVAGKLASAIKSMSIVTKAIIGLAVVMAIATPIILLQEDKPKQTSSSSINSSPKSEDVKVVENTPMPIEENTKNNSIFNAAPKRKVEVGNRKVENPNTENGLSEMINKPLDMETHELKADLKTVATEIQQGQSQVEKAIVKAPTVENKSINEPENNSQPSKSNTESDVDTLITPDIPSVFTPGDDDNFNKEFVIKIENESIYRLRVFDSKANLVFESFKKELHWNGQHFKSGENCESGKYFYIFDYQYKGAKGLRQKSGYILLTR